MGSGLWLAVSGIRNYFMHLTGCGGIVAVVGLSPKAGGGEQTSWQLELHNTGDLKH